MSLWAMLAGWSLVCVGLSSWWLQSRLRNQLDQSATTAAVRLGGVKDTLEITLQQLAALPLDLSHRPLIADYLATAHGAPANPTDGRSAEVLKELDHVSADFKLPVVSLIDRDGDFVLNSTATSAGFKAPTANVASRAYFGQAMQQGAAVQFLFGRASRAPGVYFASRVVLEGRPVGLALVKQDSDSLNRLLSAAEGAGVLLTDANGVVVLSNQPELLLRRVPGAAPLTKDAAQALYQHVPETLDWQQSRETEGARTLLITRIDGVRHVTLMSALPSAPFTVWVLEPLDEEASITTTTWIGGSVFWIAGGLLIWLGRRRAQLLQVAMRARRDVAELTRSLPLTVFRYTEPLHGDAHFSFIGPGVDALFGIDEATLVRDPKLPWRLAGCGEQPPTRPLEFRIEIDGAARWLLTNSAVSLDEDGGTVFNGYWFNDTARRATRVRFAAVFEHASTSYLFFDAQHGITECNPAALRLFGSDDAKQLIGHFPWYPELSPETQADGKSSRRHALQRFREHRRKSQRVDNFEWRFRRANGEPFDAEVSVIALEWVEPPEFCALIQDITVRKLAEATLVRARVTAETTSKTKSSFLANMSHELRTPMNAIIGMTQLALEDGLPPKQRDYVEKAHRSARNLLAILNDILDLSKIEAGQMDLERIDFELESVVGEMADVLGLKADEKGLELLFSAAPDLPQRFIGDPTRLRQVLVNLGSNAIKFTDAGEVTVGMEIASQSADSIELHGWVRDTGVGLSEAEMARLFQPFAQADSSTTRRHGGTGLGLAISRQLVERMGGRLWVESAPAAGSTFHFTARLGRSAPRAPARAWMANELRGRRALLVDDNAAALEVLGRMLEGMGVAVDRCASGEAAIEMATSAAEPYTWFLIDWKMPGMDGVECTRELMRRQLHEPPCVLLVTGFARDDAMRASSDLALAGVLHKPVTPSSLYDALAQAGRADSPLRAGAAHGPSSRPAADVEVRRRLAGARVLLAEDHPLNQQLACELLRRAGIEVVLAVDGEEALAKLAAEGPFDGVLMDCQMPVMDGYSATRALRSDPRWRDLPVIAMTASALVEDRERALASGMNAHITKPINVEAMLRTMAEWIVPAGRSSAAVASQKPAGRSGFSAPIETRRGLAHCAGNEALYRRLLRGFRDTEGNFIGAVRAAWAEGRSADAMRRSHDMKGLAGAIGAERLQRAAEALEAALHTSMPAASPAAVFIPTPVPSLVPALVLASVPASVPAPSTELDRAGAELDLVLRQIDLLLEAS